MRLSLFALALLVPSAAFAQQADTTQAQTGQPPQRIRNVSIQRGQECPKSTADEVVVCSTIIEPYRIPSALRRGEPSAANQSWVNRTAYADAVGRRSGGLPDTCSPVGTGGQSGCGLAWNNAYGAERRANRRAQESVPGSEQANALADRRPVRNVTIEEGQPCPRSTSAELVVCSVDGDRSGGE